jgi:outer membrane receptor protein involved in Fe transport
LFNSDLQVSYQLNDNLSLIGGINHELRDVDNVYTLLGERDGKTIPTHEGSLPFPPDVVNDYGGYIQVNGTLLDKLRYTAGLRLTYLGISEEAYLTPRAAVVYPLMDNLNIKVLYGQAFRGPGFQEQYFKVEGVAYGANAVGRSLKPERIDTYEIAFDWNVSKKLSLRINGFYLNTFDQILRRPLGSDSLVLGHNRGRIYDNAGEQQIYGGELEVNGMVNKYISFFANASYRDGIDKETDEELPYFINFTANAGASVTLLDKIRISPNMQYVGPNEGTLGSGTPSMYEDGQDVSIDGYMLLNMVLQYKPAERLSFIGEVLNITGAEYYYPERIRRFIPKLPGGPKQSFYLKIRYEFN